MSLLFPLAPPLADWNGPGAWILLVPVVWFALALLFVLALRRLGWGGGCGRARHAQRRWEDDDGPGAPGAPWRS